MSTGTPAEAEADAGCEGGRDGGSDGARDAGADAYASCRPVYAESCFFVPTSKSIGVPVSLPSAVSVMLAGLPVVRVGVAARAGMEGGRRSGAGRTAMGGKPGGATAMCCCSDAFQLLVGGLGSCDGGAAGGLPEGTAAACCTHACTVQWSNLALTGL